MSQATENQINYIIKNLSKDGETINFNGIDYIINDLTKSQAGQIIRNAGKVNLLNTRELKDIQRLKINIEDDLINNDNLLISNLVIVQQTLTSVMMEYHNHGMVVINKYLDDMIFLKNHTLIYDKLFDGTNRYLKYCAENVPGTKEIIESAFRVFALNFHKILEGKHSNQEIYNDLMSNYWYKGETGSIERTLSNILMDYPYRSKTLFVAVSSLLNSHCKYFLIQSNQIKNVK